MNSASTKISQRLLALLLMLLMTVSLAACGGNNGGTPPANSGTPGGDSQTPDDSAQGGQLAAEQVLNLRLVDLKLLDVNDVRNANEFQVLT